MTDRPPSGDEQGIFRRWVGGDFADRLKSNFRRTSIGAILIAVVSTQYIMTLWSNPELAARKRAESFRSNGQFDQAIAEYDIAIGRAPSWHFYYIDRGTTYRMQGNLDAALADLTKSIELDPNDANAYFERGQTWRAKGDSERALSDFAEANRLNPKSGPPYFGRALILRDQRAFADAVIELDHALDRGQMPAWYVERARIKFLELDQLPQAADDFAAAVRAAIERRNIGELLYGADLEKSWKELGSPIYPDGYYLLLWAHYARVRAGQDDGPEMTEMLKDLAIPYDRALFVNDPQNSKTSEAERQALAHWPGPLYGLMLGKITLSEVLAAADAAADDVTRKRRQCDADFYLALFRRQAAEVDEAQRLLQAAADLCPNETLESSFAKNELKRHRD
jgi:tetratricopeptide (TPR) repeat protein